VHVPAERWLHEPEAHADHRRRVPAVFTRNGQVGGTVLVDGFVASTWRTERDDAAETVIVRPLRPLRRLTADDRADIEREALRLLDFASPDLAHTVQFGPQH